MAKAATVTIFAKVDQAIQELHKFRNEVETTASKIDRIGDNVGRSMQNIGRSMTMFVTLPIVAGVGLVVRSLAEKEKVLAQTAAVIQSTGGVANVTATQVRGLADSIERLTGIDDDLIMSAQNVLLTFTRVRNEVGAGNDIFDQATLAAVNLSTALGTDLQSAVIMIGKALNDPIAGITAMTRAGIQFTAQQKEQIKALVEAGDLLGAQKIILAELEVQFGGSAEAAGNTFAGSIEKAKRALEGTAESIVGHLLPHLQKLADWLARTAQKFGEMDEKGQKTTLMVLGFAAALGPVLKIVGGLVTVLGGAVSGMLALIGVGVALEVKLRGMETSMGGFIGAVFDIVLGIRDLVDWLKSLGAWLDNVRAKWDAFWGAAAGKTSTKGITLPTAPTAGFPMFHSGGIVPGPRGSNQVIVAQGGEEVIPLGGNGSGVVVNQTFSGIFDAARVAMLTREALEMARRGG